MVCPRCIMTVERILDSLSIPYNKVELGEIFMPQVLSDETSDKLKHELQKTGFELIESRVHKIVSDVKLAIAEYLENTTDRKMNLSAFINNRLAYDYSYLSDLFSNIESKSIEQYFIELRIEKVKELIVYDQLSFTEIAFRTGFSSVHHLSAQFRKVTGLTPSHFKNIRSVKRKPLDGI